MAAESYVTVRAGDAAGDAKLSGLFDIGLIYQIEWSAKRSLPTASMVDWDIRSTRFTQNTMALKRFDGDRFAQIYGSRTTEGLVLRLDVFGIHEGDRFDYRTLDLDLQDFIDEDE